MLNNLSVMGRLTRDPELRRTGSGVPVTSFTLAVERDYAQDGERETDFLDFVAWRNLASLTAKYFKKGQLMCVTGRVQTRSWTDKEGNSRRSVEVSVNSIYFAGANRSEAAQQPVAEREHTYAAAPLPEGDGFTMLEDDDAQLPF